MNFYKTERILWISAGLKLFLKNLSHLYLSCSHLFPFSFFYQVKDVRRLSFSCLRPIPSRSIPRITTWKLVSCFQVKHYILCQSFLLISSWPGCNLILSYFEHTCFLIVFQLFAYITKQRLELDTRKHLFSCLNPAIQDSAHDPIFVQWLLN